MLRIVKFLSGLYSAYESSHNQIISQSSLLNVNEAFYRKQNVATMLSQSSPVPLDNAAFASAFGGRGRGRGRGSGASHGSRGSRGRNRYCHYYHKTNNLPEKCWMKFGKPDW